MVFNLNALNDRISRGSCCVRWMVGHEIDVRAFLLTQVSGRRRAQHIWERSRNSNKQQTALCRGHMLVVWWCLRTGAQLHLEARVRFVAGSRGGLRIVSRREGRASCCLNAAGQRTVSCPRAEAQFLRHVGVLLTASEGWPWHSTAIMTSICVIDRGLILPTSSSLSSTKTQRDIHSCMRSLCRIVASIP